MRAKPRAFINIMYVSHCPVHTKCTKLPDRVDMKFLSFQDRLQLVSFENLCCTRLEGVRLIQQLACFNAETLKYLFLWRFVLPNENPILINYSYLTGESQMETIRWPLDAFC